MSPTNRFVPVIATARTLFDLLSVAAFNAWILFNFPLPLPGVLLALAASGAALVVWALFLSVRPVLRVDRYLRALVALLFMSCGLAAALDLGLHWLPAAALFIIGATVSYFEVLAASKQPLK